MRFGVCCDTERLPQLRKYGFDYVELNFSKIVLADQARFDQLREQVRQSGMAAESFNGFFPADMKLNGDVDYGRIRDYAETGFARARSLGGKVAVLGSGAARKIPDGYDRSLAEEQFIKEMLSPMAPSRMSASVSRFLEI